MSINDDERGLYHDYEVWPEELAPHAPIDQAGPEAGCMPYLRQQSFFPRGLHGVPLSPLVGLVTRFLRHTPSQVFLVLTRSAFTRSWAELWFL